MRGVAGVMALCDPFHCKFYTLKPCCSEGAGKCDWLFCFFSSPRCRFCRKLYDPPVICPWHWCKTGRKTDHVGDAETNCVGGVMFLLGKFLAGPAAVLVVGSAYVRKDLNQAFRGFVSFVLFSASVGSIMFLGPFALVIFACIFLAETFVNWFFMGRCDECYEYKMGQGMCCGKIEPLNPSPEEVRKYKKVKTAELGSAPEAMEMLGPGGEVAGDAKYREMLIAEQEAEQKSNPCAVCCLCCLSIVLAIIVGVYYKTQIAGKAEALLPGAENATLGGSGVRLLL